MKPLTDTQVAALRHLAGEEGGASRGTNPRTGRILVEYGYAEHVPFGNHGMKVPQITAAGRAFLAALDGTPAGSGVIVAFSVNPQNCNGFSWCAQVDRFRPFKGEPVRDVQFTYSRFGENASEAYEACLRAIRADDGPTYNGISWRLETAPEHAV